MTDDTPGATDNTLSVTACQWYVLQLLLSLILVQLSGLAYERIAFGASVLFAIVGLILGAVVSVVSAGQLFWQFINRPL